MSESCTGTAPSRGIWLALSGGGLRAALVGYGCVKRLHEVGLLDRVHGVSATSGGSIVAALLGLHQRAAPSGPGVDWTAFEEDFLLIARRGLLGSVTLLARAYALYVVAAALFSISWWLGMSNGWLVALLVLGLGASFHLALFVRLLAMRAHRRTVFEETAPKVGSQLEDHSSLRLLRMLFLPSEARFQEMNLLFGGNTVSALGGVRRIFLTSLNLCDGCETVFSSQTVAKLDKPGARLLWDRHGRTDGFAGVPLAQVVAASSAFPPVFRPVRILAGAKSFGCFLDGGVVDNSAVNVPRAFSVFARDSGFSQSYSHVLAVDGGAVQRLVLDGNWGRASGFFRWMKAVTASQAQDVESAHESLTAELGVAATSLGLRGLPAGELADLAVHLGRVRTDLGGFSVEECAGLALAGYLLAEVWSLNAGLERRRGVPMRDLSNILPAGYRGSTTEPAALVRHLRWSKLRFGFLRSIFRMLPI